MPISRHGLFDTDLDVTLLRSDATVSEYSLHVINQLIAHGVLLTVATDSDRVAKFLDDVCRDYSLA